MTDTKLEEIGSGGLIGYIASWLNVNSKFQHGVSFYINVWPLLKAPLYNYQIGLPSSWIIPNNEDFFKALCPKNTPAGEWTDRGPYFRDVFQTIEGGLGNWLNIAFPTSTPKYRIVATPNCYTYGISTPCWGFESKSLPARQMGLAQLSNSIVIPPDGITFSKDTNGEVLGNAWMPMYIMPKQNTQPSPTGDYSWTLFLNAKNFSGPLAFFLPEFWSKLSQRYTTIAERGLDARPGQMNCIAMEVNTVPFFEAKDSKGDLYTKIPALYYPVDSNGNTVLAHGVNFYNADAFYNPLKNAFLNNGVIPKSFNTSAKTCFKPACDVGPLDFKQDEEKQLPIKGLEKTLQTINLKTNGQCQFALQWKDKKNTNAIFPQYYKQVGNDRVAIDVSQVPAETQLQKQEFAPAETGAAYTSPAPLDKNKNWNKCVQGQPLVKVTMNDGSSLVYRWYKFIDQPSLQHLNLNAAQKNVLQDRVVRLHKEWSKPLTFMPAPTTGTLANIDPALLVTPPKGLEFGYVPIAIGQLPGKASSAQAVKATPKLR